MHMHILLSAISFSDGTGIWKTGLPGKHGARATTDNKHGDEGVLLSFGNTRCGGSCRLDHQRLFVNWWARAPPHLFLGRSERAAEILPNEEAGIGHYTLSLVSYWPGTRIELRPHADKLI